MAHYTINNRVFEGRCRAEACVQALAYAATLAEQGQVAPARCMEAAARNLLAISAGRRVARR